MDLPDLLRLLDDRAVAFRAALAAAPDLQAQVPTCPEWTLLDLAQHLGSSSRRWAATVGAGPADAPPDQAGWASTAPPADQRDALLSWSAASTRLLLAALREAGPDRGCWTWWTGSQSPATSGAVARHQVQHVTVHAYDAQAAVGAAEPLPREAARDGVDEFLSTCVAGTAPWPHDPALVDYHASDGGSWRLELSAGGARVTRLLSREGPASAAALRGTAGELVLAFYGRVPLDDLALSGDRRVLDRLVAWEPDA